MLNKFILLAALVLAPLAAGAQGLPTYPFIHVNGTGYVEAMPDMGGIDFEITASDADPALALATVEARIAEIRAIMEANGVAAEDLEIRDVRRDIKRSDGGAPLAGPIHEMRCGVKIKIRNLGKWRDVLGPLLAKPNLDGFMTGFDTTERVKVEMDLVADAIKMARRKGAGMAAGIGRKLGPVTAMSTGELKNLSRAMNLLPVENGYRASANRNEKNARDELLTITTLKMVQLVDMIFRIQ